ncbi:MAG TPA: glycerol-3-phosphate dehydrogenase C-terminal domain-containing protein, partial [Gemmatimonadaceae bacterium]|nr:glycerol-3-phosphate dehydrogenase C-terminal domain-containing protein [Gemmatimonadaceae bacterium]
VRYLLSACNRFFPAAKLTEADVISAWAGIRPLIAGGEAGEPAAASREHRLTRSPSGLLTITGGKLTTYRAMAEEAVDVVMKELRRPLAASTTGHVPLPGGELAGLETETRNAEQIAGARDVAERLVGAYGSRWRRVWALVEGDAALGRRLHPHLPYLRAEVVWATTRELACTLGDVLVRRTHLAFETRDHGASAAAEVADLLATPLGWSPATHAARLADYHAEIEQLFGVEELEPAVG